MEDGGFCRIHFLRHSGESRNPEPVENSGFWITLRLSGMNISPGVQESGKGLVSQKSLGRKTSGTLLKNIKFPMRFSLHQH
jgi:hypothetical protein